MVQFVPGRLAPHPERTHPRLHLGDYLTAALPAPPTATDWYSHVHDWPVFLNDRIGDCTEAMVGHLIEAASTYGQGQTVEISDQDVLTAYERVSGYNPADPSTDNGAVLQDVYGDWKAQGVGGHKSLAYAQVDVTSDDEIKQAITLFGAAGLGIVVTENMMTDFNAGASWTRATGQDLGGHAVPAVGYDANNVYVVTWGRVQAMTWQCLHTVTEEGWVAVLPEWFSAKGSDPQGLDLYALGEDLHELTGQPNPFPKPQPPAPTPTPPGPAPADPLHELAAMFRQWISSIESWLSKHGL